MLWKMCPYNASNFGFKIQYHHLIKLLKLPFILLVVKTTDKAYLLMTYDKKSLILLQEIAFQELKLQWQTFRRQKIDKYMIISTVDCII